MQVLRCSAVVRCLSSQKLLSNILVPEARIHKSFAHGYNPVGPRLFILYMEPLKDQCSRRDEQQHKWSNDKIAAASGRQDDTKQYPQADPRAVYYKASS
jgi:hypothetical protein